MRISVKAPGYSGSIAPPHFFIESSIESEGPRLRLSWPQAHGYPCPVVSGDLIKFYDVELNLIKECHFGEIGRDEALDLFLNYWCTSSGLPNER